VDVDNVLVECAKIYNRVYRDALRSRDYYDLTNEEEDALDSRAREEIEAYLSSVGIPPEDYEFATVHCNCSELPFPRDEERVGTGAMSGRGVDTPGLIVKGRKVCLLCGR